MTITELKEELISFTAEYRRALERQTQIVLEYEKLQRELEKFQHELLATQDEATNSAESEDSETIDLEAKLEKLKLELAHAESEVELEVRRTHARATESHIKALVGTDEKVHRLRNRILDGKAYIKTKKAEIERERGENWEKQKRLQATLQPENEELFALQEKLASVRRENLLAGVEVEVLRKKLETLKLLVALTAAK